MRIRPLSSEWESAWNAFCCRSKHAWFWHTTDWIDFLLCGNDTAVSDSFLVTYSTEIQAICPLIRLSVDDRIEYRLESPAFAADPMGINRGTLLKKVYEHIDKLSKKHDVVRTVGSISALTEHQRVSTEAHNVFQQFGYFDTTINTRLIDLHQELEIIQDEFRNSYQTDLEAAHAAARIKTTIYDQETISRSIFNEFAQMRHADPEKSSQNTDRMYRWIREGKAFLVSATYDSTPVEFAYFFDYGGNVYYGEAERDHTITDIATGPAVQWTAISLMHSRDRQYYELGPQYYGPQFGHEVSEKDRSISFYKRGFGGVNVPQFGGEKYYDADVFSRLQSERIKIYADEI